MSKNDENDKNEYRSWLEKIQLESWQLELIISGLAIFGLVEIYNYIINSSFDFLDNSSLFVFISKTILFSSVAFGCLIFIINLSFHLIIRGLWIGAVGLRYVSHDIEYEKLNYANRFRSFYEKRVGSFDNYIEKLEKLASSLFSLTFLMFFILFSFFLFISEISFIQILGEKTKVEALFKLLLLIHVILGIAVAIDFILLGMLKKIKNKYFATIYFYINRYVSFCTLSFLWRPIYLNFLDSKYTKRLLLLAIPYCMIILTFAQLEQNKVGFFPAGQLFTKNEQIVNKNYYNKYFYDEELREDESNGYINLFTIPSKKINSKLMQVFVRLFYCDDKYVMQQDETLKPYRKVGYTSPGNMLNQEMLENLEKVKKIQQSSITFMIDEQVIPNEEIECDYYIHPFNQTKGLLCFFPLDSLDNGRHYISVEKYQSNLIQNDTIERINVTIPFIYED